MDDLKFQEIIPKIQENNGLCPNRDDFLDVDWKNKVKSQSFFINLIKFLLLFGADKVFMTRKTLRTLARLNGNEEEIIFTSNSSNDCGKSTEKRENKVEKGKVRGKSNRIVDAITTNEEYVDVSKVVNCPSGGYNEFPLNFIVFLAILALKSIGFQINLFIKFFTLPIRISYSLFMFLMFPIQTILQFRSRLTKKMFRIWGNSYFFITSLIFDKFKVKKSVISLGLRFGWAFFWAIYVCFVLMGLLVLGFVIGGLSMRVLVEEPIERIENLNFDYTKASPVAFVPLMSSSGLIGYSNGVDFKDGLESSKHIGDRAIPYNHKLQLTVSLTLPESDYNRKLGVFQVRVEFLSKNGKVTAGSSYPCMLRFKSQPVRFVETIFKTAPLIAGFQSETQTLIIKTSDLTEGSDPTALLKVIVEQRAEYQSGAGIPEIYGASLYVDSELPLFKRIIWSWRRTVFVWISVLSFLTEMVFVLIFFRSLIVPQRSQKIVGAKVESNVNQISWYKSL